MTASPIFPLVLTPHLFSFSLPLLISPQTFPMRTIPHVVNKYSQWKHFCLSRHPLLVLECFASHYVTLPIPVPMQTLLMQTLPTQMIFHHEFTLKDTTPHAHKHSPHKHSPHKHSQKKHSPCKHSPNKHSSYKHSFMQTLPTQTIFHYEFTLKDTTPCTHKLTHSSRHSSLKTPIVIRQFCKSLYDTPRSSSHANTPHANTPHTNDFSLWNHTEGLLRLRLR